MRDATVAPPPAALPAMHSARTVPAWRARMGAYVSLMKPHVTVLLLGTTLAAMVVAERGFPSLGVVLATLLGGAMAAGSANAINCYWDRDIDSIMSRTVSRALPTHKVSDRNALYFGLSLGAGSFLL
ncbi:MAG TPA: UbiA family prenyltransferase, partial [Ktedonobacterales bacterium]